MSFFGLFAGAKAALNTAETGAKIVEKATDGIIKAGDVMFYTQEEKAQATQKGFDTIVTMWSTFQSEHAEQSIARRELAKMFATLYAGVMGVGIGLILIGDKVRLASLIEFLVAMYFGWIILSVITTYFVPHQLSKLGILSGGDKK